MSLYTYRNNLNNIKFLSKEEEIELFNDYKLNGNISARNKIIEGQLPQILKIASTYFGKNKKIKEEDIISTANFYVLSIFDKFDPTLGNRFFSFYKPNLMWYLFTYINKKDKLIDNTYELSTYGKNIILKYEEDTSIRMNEDFIENDIKRALNMLKDVNRDIIIKKYYKDIEISSIAKDNGKTRQAVDSKLKTIHNKLNKILKEHGY